MSDPSPFRIGLTNYQFVNKVHPTLQKNRTYVDQNPVIISACLLLFSFFFGKAVEIFLVSNLFKGLIPILSLKRSMVLISA